MNHRTIVGRQRRARTEARILEAALHVFAAKGPDAPVIDDFISAAGVARGTFYNYFSNTRELLEATSTWLSDDVIQSIEKEIRGLKDPVLRHGMGLRLWLQKSRQDEAWCRFVARTWFHESRAKTATMRDIRRAIQLGLYRCGTVAAAYDLSAGAVRQAMIRLTEDPRLRTQSYGDEIARMILQGLGAKPEKIAEAMKRPLPDMRRPTRTVE